MTHTDIRIQQHLYPTKNQQNAYGVRTYVWKKYMLHSTTCLHCHPAAIMSIDFISN